MSAEHTLPWQPIETAPKDGTVLAVWCQSAETLYHECRWEKGRWKAWQIGGYDQMTWLPLESFEVPTHWLHLTPPKS